MLRSMETAVLNREAAARRGRNVEYFTIAWNSVEGLVAVISGALAGSISLVGFGIDSFIEVISGSVLLWRMSVDADIQRRERNEKLSLRVVGACFLALAVYVGYESLSDLLTRKAPEHSIPGIVLACVSLVVMKKEADALHTRAVAGEDFDALQKAAFTAGGLKATPPSAKLGKIRRTGLPPEHAQVFDLKPGEVSAVIPDTGGYFIYKLVSKQQAPLASVKEEIHNTLLGQKMKDAQAEFQSASTPVLSEAYFGPEQTAPKPPSMARPEAPKKPQPK